MVTSSRNERIGRTTFLLVALMLLQSAPLLTVSASTTPPSSSGDWTINANEVAYLNSTDQALVQGDVLIHGELHINGGSLFIWGSSDGQRELKVFSGGLLNVTNGGTIGSYTSVYYDFTVDDFAHISVTDSRIEKATSIQSTSLNMTLSNVHFEDTRLSIIDNSTENGEFDPIQNTVGANWAFDDLRFVNSTQLPVLNLNSASSTLTNWTLTLSDVNISVSSGTSYADTIEVGSDWWSNLVFDGLSVTDENRYSSSVYLAANDWLLKHQSYNSNLEIRNSLFYDSPEHKAIYSNSQLVLSNVTITDIYHPDQTYDWYSYGESSSNTGTDTYTMLVETNVGVDIVADRLTIENSGVMTEQKTGEKMVICSTSNSSGSNCWMYGPDFFCNAIHSPGTLTLSNSSITGNCLAQFEYHGYAIFGYQDYYCSSQSDDLDDYYFDGDWYDTSGASWQSDSQCRKYHSYAIGSESAHISDSIIESNAKMTVWFSYPNTGYSQHRHGSIHTGGVKVSGNSTIVNSTISNNGDSCMCAHAAASNQHLTLSSYQVLARTGADEVIWVNNSFLNSTMTPDEVLHETSTSSGWGSFQHWYSFGISQGTAFITNTELNYYPGSMNYGTTGDANPGEGEVVRRWTVQVHVVDPDGVFTPYANVTAYENNGVWNIGTWSTGPNGSSVNFIGRQYSLTESSNYSYTPHSIEVTLTNYSNSTSVNITGPTVITVYDPTPDAFPGDITQDWDSDGDGYGDNISGNNPDHFPHDSTQWNDTDGDGWGDNYTWTLNSSNGLRIQNGDAFINDATQWSDVDGDGLGDNYTWTIDSLTGLRNQNGDAFINDSTQWSDVDGDGWGDHSNGNNADEFPYDGTQWVDTDGDGYGDNYSWTLSITTNLRDQNGDAFPNDSTQWSDADGDGWGDNSAGNNPDEFPEDSTQWIDEDQDGLGDNQSGNNPDPYLNDSDNDGYNNSVDEFPWNPTQWEDNDNDGLGDNQSGTAADPYLNDTDNDGYNNTVDDFPFDPTQWSDSDGDGMGDNPDGNNPDPLPNDTDNDGYNNSDDDFPLNPTQWSDADGDGWGDNPNGHPADDFPDDPSQWSDADGDGHGDNANGNDGDAFPNNPTQWSDADGDGFGDNPNGSTPDAFPYDATQWSDFDGDGYGDNYHWILNFETGLRDQEGDAFPFDPTQSSDLDGDGYGDNSWGMQSDFAPYDPTQWADSDGDGVPDNYFYDLSQVTSGACNNTHLRQNQVGDAFPFDPTESEDTDGDGWGDNIDWNFTDHTQWIDEDEDGLGDNPLGCNPDPTPGDGDNDGYPDSEDAFPNDPNEVFDTDGDGIGDNNDTDDDGDGWEDAQEIECYTSVIDSSSTPIDVDLDGLCNWLDLDDDGDGLLDSLDSCPNEYGNSTYMLSGCPDSDGDSVSDQNDLWPENPYMSLDSDGDGYHDPVDVFPNDGTQWFDSDQDGLGDNQQGNNPDPYLDDSDNDGYINQIDSFPLEPTQWYDDDNDGFGDNLNGVNPDPYLDDSDNDGYANDVDMYRLDPTQWEDTDGDGYGDNPSGTFGDKFPDDSTQCCDRDGDGFGDNPNGNNPDAFPDEPTQWYDLDGDGLGDNPSGVNGDPYPGDYDNDGVPDEIDVFPEDPDRTLDDDQDGLSVEEEGAILDGIPERDMPIIFGAIFLTMLLSISLGYTWGIVRNRP